MGTLKHKAAEAERLADKLKQDLDRCDKEKTGMSQVAEMKRAEMTARFDSERRAIQK